jgi:hypothetical protein
MLSMERNRKITRQSAGAISVSGSSSAGHWFRETSGRASGGSGDHWCEHLRRRNSLQENT